MGCTHRQRRQVSAQARNSAKRQTGQSLPLETRRTAGEPALHFLICTARASVEIRLESSLSHPGPCSGVSVIRARLQEQYDPVLLCTHISEGFKRCMEMAAIERPIQLEDVMELPEFIPPFTDKAYKFSKYFKTVRI